MIADDIRRYYGRDGLEDAIAQAPRDAPAQLDSLHCRVRQATSELARLAAIERGTRVLDVGCGLGGAARYLAATYGARVTGLELTPRLVSAARLLTARAGLANLVDFTHGTALAAPFPGGSFDCVWLQHVLVNISDKTRLFAELRRVLVAHGRLALHEVVAYDAHGVRFPLPWAPNAATSFVARSERLRIAIENAGFMLQNWTETTPLALNWCRDVLARTRDNPAGLGWRIPLGPDAGAMIQNLVHALETERLGVVTAVFRRQEPSSRVRSARVLDDSVELGADEDRETRHVEPQHRDDDGADRAVSGGVTPKVRYIHLERERAGDP
jgi:SAM-dependent methyltransferase